MSKRPPLLEVLAAQSPPDMNALKENYDIAQHPAVLIQSLRRCQQDQIAPPDWVIEQLAILVEPLLDQRPGRGQRSPDEIAMQYVADYMRSLMVDVLRQKRNISYREVFQAASDEIATLGGWGRWGGSAEAIRQSYRRHRKRLQEQERERRGKP